jgi:hypothetical protein
MDETQQPSTSEDQPVFRRLKKKPHKPLRSKLNDDEITKETEVEDEEV